MDTFIKKLLLVIYMHTCPCTVRFLQNVAVRLTVINLEKIYQPRSIRRLHSRQICKNNHSAVVLSSPLSYRLFLFKLISDKF
jgi:hypothetical protein